MSKKLQVGFTEKGNRAGEHHPMAKLSDRDVDMIRQLHEDGLGYRAIARKFELSRYTVRDIVKCNRRYATVVRFDRVGVCEPPKFDPLEVRRKYVIRRENAVLELAAEYKVGRARIARLVADIELGVRRPESGGVHVAGKRGQD